ncbi:RNA recognition motif domain-containing protein [Candidatus Dependentiae bacterium]
MNIYVGNISHQLTEDELREAFEAFGTVEKASIIKDKFTGNSRGFGFVEMPENEEAEKAIAELNGQDLNGRALNVSQARPRPEGGRDRRSSGGRGGFGGSGGGGRGGFGGSSGGGRGGFGGSSGGRGRF